VGLLLLAIALVLPIVAGALCWPWWVALECATLAFIGFFAADYSRTEIMARRGVLRGIGPALAVNAILCGVLFEEGRLLSHLRGPPPEPSLILDYDAAVPGLRVPASVGDPRRNWSDRAGQAPVALADRGG
jgi:hypothetical protein